jgi:hypothetical protein
MYVNILYAEKYLILYYLVIGIVLRILYYNMQPSKQINFPHINFTVFVD